MKRPFNFIGARVWRLVVLQAVYRCNSETQYLCLCECGGYAITTGSRLKAGKAKSCGCLKVEMARQIIRRTEERQQAMQAEAAQFL